MKKFIGLGLISVVFAFQAMAYDRVVLYEHFTQDG
jgi:hypothetical protein